MLSKFATESKAKRGTSISEDKENVDVSMLAANGFNQDQQIYPINNVAEDPTDILGQLDIDFDSIHRIKFKEQN